MDIHIWAAIQLVSDNSDNSGLSWLGGLRGMGNVRICGDVSASVMARMPVDFTEQMAANLWSIIGYTVLICIISFTSMGIFGMKQICIILIVVANIVETGVSFPQFNEIVLNRRIENSSPLLVSQFAFGDLSKIVMFLLAGSGWPFVMGGVLQFCVDSFVGVSFLWQKRNGEGKSGKKLDAEIGIV
jgi:hypothetical protein